MTLADALDWSLFRVMQALPVDACSALGALLSDRMGRRAYPEADARARAVIARMRPDLATSAATLDATSKRLWEGIGRTHGRLVTLDGATAMATYHPAAALRGGPSVVDVMRADLRLLKRVLGP